MFEQTLDVSVVIVNWNTVDLLRDCVQSVIDQTPSCSYEIIVTDNGSHDSSVEMIKQVFPSVVLIENQSNVGFVKANNQAFAICKGRFILMLNSDTIILERAIEKTIKYMETDSQIGIAGCKLLYRDGSFQNSCFRFPGITGTVLYSTGLSHAFPSLNWDRYGNVARHWQKPVQVDCVMGSFLMIRRDVLEEIGYLDEEFFMYAEETDLCYRARQHGKKVVYYPGASIVHYYGGSQKSWDDSVWSYHAITRGIMRFLTKWKPIKAYAINAILLICLIPRIMAWLVRDIVCGISTMSLSWKYIKKARLLPMHLSGVISPGIWRKRWEKK